MGYVEDGNRRYLSNSGLGSIKRIKSMELLPEIREFRGEENSKIEQEKGENSG